MHFDVSAFFVLINLWGILSFSSSHPFGPLLCTPTWSSLRGSPFWSSLPSYRFMPLLIRASLCPWVLCKTNQKVQNLCSSDCQIPSPAWRQGNCTWFSQVAWIRGAIKLSLMVHYWPVQKCFFKWPWVWWYTADLSCAVFSSGHSDNDSHIKKLGQNADFRVITWPESSLASAPLHLLRSFIQWVVQLFTS